MPKYATLVEPNMQNSMRNLLQNCHEWKTQYYNRIINASLLFMFILITSTTLYYCKTTKQSTTKEKIRNEQYKKEHTLRTLQNLQSINQKVQSERISSVPFDRTFNLDNKIFM